MRTLSYAGIAQLVVNIGIFSQKMCYQNCKMDSCWFKHE